MIQVPFLHLNRRSRRAGDPARNALNNALKEWLGKPLSRKQMNVMCVMRGVPSGDLGSYMYSNHSRPILGIFRNQLNWLSDEQFLMGLVVWTVADGKYVYDELTALFDRTEEYVLFRLWYPDFSSQMRLNKGIVPTQRGAR